MNAPNMAAPDGASHKIEHGGETRFAYSPSVVFAICDELIAKYGGGVPQVTPLTAPTLHLAPPIEEVPPTEPAPAAIIEAPSFDVVEPPPFAEDKPIERLMSGGIDLIGKARSEQLKEAGEESGFSFRETVYARGTPVIALGEENARISRAEHDAKDDIGVACDKFVSIIKAENRRDLDAPVQGIGMDGLGNIVTDSGTFAPTEAAFSVLLGRLGIGGAAYLSKCWPRLRAHNFNAWTSKMDADERDKRAIWDRLDKEQRVRFEDPSRDPLKFRLRDGRGALAECYGVVTPSYTAFNVDRVTAAIKIAMPPNAKGEFSYDGHRTTFDILFHSNVAPTQYVAGEFFKAGIRVRASDSGDGSIIVSAIVWQNLCLNLIVIDEASKPLDRIRHIGDVQALARRLSAALEAGKLSLAAFLKAWDYAVEERLDNVENLDVPKGVEVPLKFEEILPGIFNGLYERELVPLKKPKAAIPLLVEAWKKDTSSAAGPTRASVVNAITRYAHTAPMTPWEEDELERAAGALLTRKAPKSKKLAALPYVPLG